MPTPEESSFPWELADLIRMNQLIRGQIDVHGFVEWYDALPTDGQVALLWHLHDFGQQAGGDEQTFRTAVEAAGLTDTHPLVRPIASFRGGGSYELGQTLGAWLMHLEAEERRALLPVLVHFFGLAEGAAFARETVESCNHWWHRDLRDPRVVHDLLHNPEYYRTAIKDDIALKGT